jgi:hypothetical protein
VFVLFYGLYVGYLILSSSEYSGLSSFKFSALLFVIPMVILMSGTALYQLVFQTRKQAETRVGPKPGNGDQKGK